MFSCTYSILFKFHMLDMHSYTISLILKLWLLNLQILVQIIHLPRSHLKFHSNQKVFFLKSYSIFCHWYTNISSLIDFKVFEDVSAICIIFCTICILFFIVHRTCTTLLTLLEKQLLIIVIEYFKCVNIFKNQSLVLVW